MMFYKSGIKLFACVSFLAIIAGMACNADAVKDIPDLNGKAAVMILASPRYGTGPLTVQLKAFIKQNLEQPVKFIWWFGDGTESTEMTPPPHYYETGRYSVVLEVWDKAGKRYTAAVTIHSEAIGGCGPSCDY